MALARDGGNGAVGMAVVSMGDEMSFDGVDGWLVVGESSGDVVLVEISEDRLDTAGSDEFVGGDRTSAADQSQRPMNLLISILT